MTETKIPDDTMKAAVARGNVDYPKSQPDFDELLDSYPWDRDLNHRLAEELAAADYPGRFTSTSATLGASIGIIRALVENNAISRSLARAIARDIRIAVHMFDTVQNAATRPNAAICGGANEPA